MAAPLEVVGAAPRAATAAPFLELSGVGKSFGPAHARTEVLHDIDLAIPEGEFLAIVGFSGSGKSTLISLMAGLIAPDEGEVRFQGRRVTGPGPERGVVFQSYALLPWLTVAGNVALAVDQVHAGESRDERRRLVEHYVAMVNLTPALAKYPSELSGGMRQRVAVARALAMDPQMLLLDEPLSALDALTRGSLQTEIERIWERDRKTVVLITNSVDEAILLADRIIPLRPGPRASLGPSFRVDLPRPRDRTAVNHDARFRDIRNEVTRFLIDVQSRTPSGVARMLDLPDLIPVDLSRGYRRWP